MSKCVKLLCLPKRNKSDTIRSKDSGGWTWKWCLKLFVGSGFPDAGSSLRPTFRLLLFDLLTPHPDLRFDLPSSRKSALFKVVFFFKATYLKYSTSNIFQGPQIPPSSLLLPSTSRRDITRPLTQLPSLLSPYYMPISPTKWYKKVSNAITLVRTF